MSDNTTGAQLARTTPGWQTRPGSKDMVPGVGEWCWVRHDNDEETLMCVRAVNLNHVVLNRANGQGYGDFCNVHFNEVVKDLRPAPEWKQVLESKIAGARQALQDKVKDLARLYADAGLGELGEGPDADPGAGAVMAVSRGLSPERQRAALEKLKSEDAPAAKKDIDRLMGELAGLETNMTLALRHHVDLQRERMQEVDDRIFALRLYAGLEEAVVQIADGKPAPGATPLAVRQLLLYMDEETLFDYESGGMDFTDIERFDEWLAKPENRDRILPEPRCVVAMQVRRHDKYYGRPESIADAFRHAEWNRKNEWTYLAMRNGGRVYRLACEVEFKPRLVPLRDAFTGPVVKEPFWSTDKPKELGWEDMELHDAVVKRKREATHYNRVMFLLQGLLDRTEVFAPHPPINLLHEDDFAQYVRLVRDEEDSLPSSNTVMFTRYVEWANQGLKAGDWICCWAEDKKKRSWNTNARPYVLPVDTVHKNGTVSVSWPYGTRYGYQFGDWGKWGEWEVNKRLRARVPLNKVLRLAGYRLGDYKIFLCDRALKGEYLQWTRPLLEAEEWARNNQQRKENGTMRTDTGEIVHLEGPDYEGQARTMEQRGGLRPGTIAPMKRPLTVRERKTMKVDKYAPCGCGSGKKFKFCCHAPQAGGDQ